MHSHHFPQLILKLLETHYEISFINKILHEISSKSKSEI